MRYVCAMFKFAHISDIHLGPLPNLTLRELFSKRITGFVNWHRNRRKHLFVNTLDLLLSDLKTREPDQLVITGDLVNLATKIETRLAGEWLRTIGDPYDTTVVPGNHDAYVPGAHDKSVNEWYPFIKSDDDPAEWPEEDHIFPTLRRRGPLAIIGCSTSNATLPFSASGYYGSRQARETVNLLKKAGDEGLFRVVLIHHPRSAAPPLRTSACSASAVSRQRSPPAAPNWYCTGIRISTRSTGCEAIAATCRWSASHRHPRAPADISRAPPTTSSHFPVKPAPGTCSANVTA